MRFLNYLRITNLPQWKKNLVFFVGLTGFVSSLIGIYSFVNTTEKEPDITKNIHEMVILLEGLNQKLNHLNSRVSQLSQKIEFLGSQKNPSKSEIFEVAQNLRSLKKETNEVKKQSSLVSTVMSKALWFGRESDIASGDIAEHLKNNTDYVREFTANLKTKKEEVEIISKKLQELEKEVIKIRIVPQTDPEDEKNEDPGIKRFAPKV